MSVIIKDVEENSYAHICGIKPDDLLISINGNEIADVLDFRFYQNDKKLKIVVLRDGKKKKFKIKKDEFEEIGLQFETYLMDKQQKCRNKCIFCFIDQMPEGMRESLYFKDDDSRLSFLFGNYITLTNISDHEVDRIIKMHISPINISVHTTNPDLRVKMMGNRFAGKALDILKKLGKAGIALNCQLVLCPGINDGEELRRSLNDLTSIESVGCVACVPVGLTKYRDNLYPLKSYDKQTASEVIDIIDEFGDKMEKERGERICYAADEFYLKAEREIPNPKFYGDFLQLENGVGLMALLKQDCISALDSDELPQKNRNVSMVTGLAAADLIKEIVDLCGNKWHNFNCKVYPIINNFFGEKITVAGLITAKDIIEQLKDKDLGDELLIPSVMLRQGENYFLDDITVEELEETLNIKIRVVSADDGYDLIDKLRD